MPGKLRCLLAAPSHKIYRADASSTTAGRVVGAHKQEAELDAGRPQLSARADLALRLAGAVLVLACAVIGFGQPASIVLVAVGLMFLILDQSLKAWVAQTGRLDRESKIGPGHTWLAARAVHIRRRRVTQNIC